MDEMFAIKCQNCGGPMYSHQAKRSFECAYCGTVVPWQADAGEPKSALGIRHTPLTVVDGLLKLTHVSQLERPEDPDWYFFNAYWRTSCSALARACCGDISQGAPCSGTYSAPTPMVRRLLKVPGLSRSATPILLPQDGHSNTR